MTKQRIAFDVDGVFVNFLQEISEFITKEHSINRIKDYCLKQYNLSERFSNGIPTDIFNEFKTHFEKNRQWESIQEMPNIDLAHKIMGNPNFEVFFVTSLPVHLFNDRLVNLNSIFNNSIDKEQLFCVPLGQSKSPFIKALQPDFFFEDNLTNLYDCESVGNHKSIWIDLQDSIYNKDKLHSNIIQVTSLNEGIQKSGLNLTNLKSAALKK